MLKSILFRKKYRKNTFRKSGSAEVLTLLTLLSQKYNADLEKSGLSQKDIEKSGII